MRAKTMLISLAVIGCVFALSTFTRREVRKAPDENASVQRGERVPSSGASDSTRELATRPESMNVATDPSAAENAASISAFARRSFTATERPATKRTAPSGPRVTGRQSAQKRELADPVARVALSFVGADEDAEAYWVQAINDPNLSAHERQDLIEDLNEEGFADPHHPTWEDLPLIVSRLMIIEALAPEAMDEVNSEAFAEAKKDLEQMANLAQE